jgi:hypothetical protein
MTGILTLAPLWLGLALIATLLAIWLRIAAAIRKSSFFLPRHLLPRGEREQQAPAAQPITAAGGGK